MCIVFEDDVILTDDQVKAVNTVIPDLPSEWGIWILGCYLPNLILQPLEKKPWSRVYNFTAAHAYILTRSAAIKLLEEATPIETHIEYYITGTSIIKDFTIVHHPDVHFEFFRKNGPRTEDSNTSQHKASGCPSCNLADDYKQIYRGFTRKTKRGIEIMGIVDGEQSKKILKLKGGSETI